MATFVSPFSRKFPLWFKLINMVILVPIIAWPLIFFSTLFFFDDPNASKIESYGLFFLVNAYPIYLVLLFFLNTIIYRKIAMLGLLLPLSVIGLIGWFIFELVN